MNRIFCLSLLMSLFTLLSACAQPVDDSALVDRGRYLIKISGCNDCHTDNYMQSAGSVPEGEWLKGSKLGWHNESGTTYAANLRLMLSQMSERAWIKKAKNMRPNAPMAWYRIIEISEEDLRAMYRYILWLGPAGEPAPQALPAGVTPPEPFLFFPKAH